MCGATSGADHARHQPEIRRQPIVEPVNHVAQEASRPRLVPGLRRPTGETRQGLGVRRRFLGELERHCRASSKLASCGGPCILDLLPLLAQQQRQQVVGSEAAPDPGSETRVQRRARPPHAHAVLAEQLLPHLDVTLLHPGQLDVDILALLVRLLAGQHQVEVGGVGFILPMVQPVMQGGAVEGRSHA